MSVYTHVSHAALAEWIKPLCVGNLLTHVGIAAGMQNSNYYVSTDQGRYVLTLFEQAEPATLDFHLALQAHLAQCGIPCPQPLADAQGKRWHLLAGKPAALLSCLSGRDIEQASPAHCQQLGQQLAALHLAGRDFPQPLLHACDAAWRQSFGHALLPLLQANEAALLADELAFQAAQDNAQLPRGIIHADLFRDNVLWDENGQLSGLLDFYFAGEDVLLFDLAVVANDWAHDAACLAALLNAYHQARPLSAAEQAAWPAMCRAAALRFWLLRLDVRHRPRAGELVTIKDPEHFRRLLEQLRLAPDALPL